MGDKEQRQSAYRSGADLFIEKPIDMTKLRQSLQRILGLQLEGADS